jgi:RNA polymerase sigma-70 factor, ECF subfamily
VTDRNVILSGAGDRTSSTLLERARDRDELAWGKMVDVYTPLVWRWCRRLGLKPDDIEDICQEVFRAVHRALPGFRRDREGYSFRGWLRMITLNKVRDMWGKKRSLAVGGSDAFAFLNDVADPNGEVAVEAEDEQEVGLLYRRAVQVMRDEFEDRTWQAFWQVTVDDQPVEQVAARLRMSKNAVYLARSRIRKRLREFLAQLGVELPAND